MLDPYKTLNVSPDSTDEEITKAYRLLAKKYHPDLHPNDPYCEQKMKEINQAYDLIQSNRDNHHDQQYYYNNQSNDFNYTDIEILITQKRFQEAWILLCQYQNRPSRWYFLSSIAHAGFNDRIQAMYDIKQALSMEPNNQEYRFFYQQLLKQSQGFEPRQRIHIPFIFKLIFYFYIIQFIGRFITGLLFG